MEEKRRVWSYGETLSILTTLFWIISLFYLFSLLQKEIPVFAGWILLFGVFGFLSCALFGFIGVISEIFSLTNQIYIEGFSKFPVSTGIILFWSGPLAPISLIVFGVCLLKLRAVPLAIGLLIIFGGIAFPVSRISRTEWIAHTAYGLLLIPFSWTGFRSFSAKRS